MPRLAPLLTAAALAIPLGGPPADAQARRVYTTEEATALKCAWIISMTASVLEGAALISTRDKEISIAISSRILQLHVSGTERQKLAALEQVGNRRDVETTVDEFRKEATACVRRYPVE